MSEVEDTITQEAAETADAQEWDTAFKKYDSEKGIKTEEDKPAGEEDKKPTDAETAAAEEAKKAAEEEEARKNETPEQKAEREKKEAEEADKPAETPEEAQARRDAAARARELREASRDFMADTEAVVNDIMVEMFKDKDGKLYDADGDEIKSIEDVMLLRNPNTGKNFTEDEAGAYFLKASQNAKEERQNALAMAKQYAEVNLAIKDEADTVKDKYGAFLSDPKNATLKAEVWADYQETLQVDPDSGVIIKAPVSMIRFYDRALKPYADAQSDITSAQQAKAEAEAAAEKAKAEAAAARKRNDREDIFARGDNGRSTLTKDEEEWADAKKSYYGKK